MCRAIPLIIEFVSASRGCGIKTTTRWLVITLRHSTALILAATSAGARAVVAGDLNAELRRQVEARGASMRRADVLLGKMIISAALQATGTGEAKHNTL